MRVGIIGHTGFVGHNLIMGLNDKYKAEGISIRDQSGWDRIKEFDVVINLVGKAHDHKGKATESDYYIPNVQLLKEIYREFIKSSASVFIHVSSLAAVEEYGSKIYLDEISSCNPSSFYGKSKREAEQWLLNQPISDGKKVIILRPPMIHGPGDKGNLGLLYKLVSKGIPYPLYSFNNKRSFISINNFNYFINEIITKHELIDSGVYHIADDEAISTKEIIEIIKDVTNRKILKISFPKLLIKGLAMVGDVLPIPLNTKRLKKMTSNLLVSNTKIKSVLGIDKLPLSSKEGMKMTIQSFKQAK